MKKFLLLSSFLCLLTIGNAQVIKAPGSNTDFSDKINKIVLDFRSNYRTIQGEQLPSQEEMDVFRSSVSLPNTQQNVIYRFHSKVDTTASWQSLIYQGDVYEDALKAYRNTCRMLNKSRVSLPSGQVGFSGKIENPDANLTFTSSSFQLNADDPVYKDFYAEIELINTGFESWEVHLNLHNKKKDTDRY